MPNSYSKALERARRGYGFYVTGYVIMPEHVHLLVSEPERSTLPKALQAVKQSVARQLIGARKHFRQARYDDFNVWTVKKRVEKLRYMHRNPVKRGLAEKPEDWAWSSFRHYATGEEGVVEVESEWTGRKREQMGMPLRVKITQLPHPSKSGLGGARDCGLAARCPILLPLLRQSGSSAAHALSSMRTATR
jgi:REP-associated tyrosine transposase